MADQMVAFDIESVRSRIDELSDVLRNANEIRSSAQSDSEILLREFIQSLEAQVEQIVSEHSDAQFLKENDLSLYLEELTADVKTIEAENDGLCSEIERLKQTRMESACELEGELESLNCALDNAKPTGHEEKRACANGSSHGETCRLSNEHGEQNFQELDLNYQIERSSAKLKLLQDLDHTLKKCEAIEKIEESFSGLKVIEFEGNHMRLSLKTYIPSVEGLMHHQKLRDTVEPSELNHKLQIEVESGSLEVKNAEIFPNDVYIGDILEAVTSFSQVDLAMVQRSSSLRWFLQKVQDRIVQFSLRQFMVKIANRSRHSLEYSDREELIMASVRGIDAFIKPSQGWPLSTSALKLISLKPSDHDAEEISLRFLCEIEDLANSLDISIRQNITSFIDAIEEIIAQKLRQELHAADHVAK